MCGKHFHPSDCLGVGPLLHIFGTRSLRLVARRFVELLVRNDNTGFVIVRRPAELGEY